MFSKWLVEIKDVFDSWFNRTYIGEWTPPPPPMTLFHEIYKNCASRLEKPEFDEISVLIKYSNDVVYVPLILMRMAQLDLAGDDDYARNYVPTLKWSSERLWKLIFNARDGVDGFESELMGMRQVICGICCRGIGIPDKITIVPCPERHKFHKRCLEYWLGQTHKHKYCPYHQDEFIL